MLGAVDGREFRCANGRLTASDLGYAPDEYGLVKKADFLAIIDGGRRSGDSLIRLAVLVGLCLGPGLCFGTGGFLVTV